MTSYDKRWSRTTVWTDDAGRPWQCAVAIIDPDSADILSEATEAVGPFDDVDAAVRLARIAATALADGHYRGQQFLEL